MQDTKIGMGSDYLLNPYTKDPIELTESDLCRSTDTGFTQCDDVNLHTQKPRQTIILGSLLLLILLGLFSFQIDVVVDGVLVFTPDTVSTNVLAIHPAIVVVLSILFGIGLGVAVKKSHLTRLMLFDQ